MLRFSSKYLKLKSNIMKFFAVKSGRPETVITGLLRGNGFASSVILLVILRLKASSRCLSIGLKTSLELHCMSGATHNLSLCELNFPLILKDIPISIEIDVCFRRLRFRKMMNSIYQIINIKCLLMGNS